MRGLLTTLTAAMVVSFPALAGELSGPAPNFTLQSRSGETVSLADLRGDVVMINFWATWCGPCRQEMPHLEALYQRYSDLGFTLLGVNVEEDASGADEFLAHVAQPCLRDGWFDAVGYGRMALSYPQLAADVLAGRPLARKLVCRTFSDCTTAPRHGIVSGCWPLDPFYRERPEREAVEQAKKAAEARG